MKYFVSSDPHGYFTIMKEALDSAGFEKGNDNHKLIICGDIFDRGEEPIEMLQYLQSLGDQFIFIRGNHEDLLPKCYEGYNNYDKETLTEHTHNGTLDTVRLLGETYRSEAMRLINKSLDYFETEHYIFVHGWIPTKCKVIEPNEHSWYRNLSQTYWPMGSVYNKDWRNASKEEWEEARWVNGMSLWNKGIREMGKTIVCGHWNASWGHANLHNDGKEFLSQVETFYIDPETGKQEPHENQTPFIDDGIIALDACTARSKKINIIVLEEQE